MNYSSRALLIIWLVTAGLLLVAGGVPPSLATGLPTFSPTLTALPPGTPTAVPPADEAARLPPVDWADVEIFRAAMRPDFAGDIDRFVDRNRYYIEATLTFERGTAIIQGAERVRYTNHSTDTLDEIVFRLYPNLPALGGRMEIYHVELNSTPVEPVLAERDTALIVPLDAPLEPGASAEVYLEFSTAAERGLFTAYGQYGYQQDTFSAPEWYPALSVYETERGWWMVRPSPYGDAAYLETGLYEIYLTAPNDVTLILSGEELDPYPVGGGMLRHHIVSGPMRDSLLVASPQFSEITGYTPGGIAVNVYYWPGGKPAAEEALAIGIDAITTFDAAFGPYPFKEFDIVETFNWTGIEYPGMTIVADRLWEFGNAYLETVIVHEIGHQWFYSLVGNNQVEHPWLDESLTSYTEYVYWRRVYSEDRYQAELNDDRDTYAAYLASGAPDMVLNLPVSAYVPNNAYGPIIYVKGPLFFAELEDRLGHDIMLDALQQYVTRHRYDVATSYDVLAAFEAVSGQDLDAIFYEWVGEFEGLDPAALASEGE